MTDRLSRASADVCGLRSGAEERPAHEYLGRRDERVAIEVNVLHDQLLEKTVDGVVQQTRHEPRVRNLEETGRNADTDAGLDDLVEAPVGVCQLGRRVTTPASVYQSDHVAVLKTQVDEGSDHLVGEVEEVLTANAFEDPRRLLHKCGDVAATERYDEMLLARKIGVEAALGDARRRGDLGHRGVMAHLPEDAQRCVQKGLAALVEFGWGGGAPWHLITVGSA